ncbi:hypothetical protein GCM10028803_35260 [Larkinella knui]|uniref:Uncharacterized protein n=1 Tax=Larkinella knui TaxID=2025310 RepID=A0A3P1CDV5_9BACT|nr:hypothetical protein [Larkinella knui]RRB11400.1 hypothetical protein EHT87_23220 [Larkinella knui]
MKTILIILTVFCLFACGKDEKDAGPELEAEAMLHADNLAADGCRTHVTLHYGDLQKQIKYAPDAESAAKIESFVGQSMEKSAVITYRLTGNKKVVECGWGSKFDAEEIIIDSIR